MSFPSFFSCPACGGSGEKCLFCQGKGEVPRQVFWSYIGFAILAGADSLNIAEVITKGRARGLLPAWARSISVSDSARS